MSQGDSHRKADVNEARGRVPRWLVVVAGVPLLAAMVIEFSAVIARNAGWNLVGSIELVQAMILLSSSGAMIAATLNRAHAKVSLLSSRYRGRLGQTMRILLAVGGTAFFLALAIGSAWIAWDMRNAAEQSELLGVPYLPLRLVVTISTSLIAFIYARRVVSELTGR
jgi:TRAP-type C4-dicarboxylate transport system permease small subunit